MGTGSPSVDQKININLPDSANVWLQDKRKIIFPTKNVFFNQEIGGVYSRSGMLNNSNIRYSFFK